MELLIPGLILVAVMAYVSTKIKKRAAEAFTAERIDTPEYSLEKPDGFLHVLVDEKHEFMAYSKDFGEDETSRLRRATIELDVIAGSDIAAVSKAIKSSAESFEVREETTGSVTIKADERANETEFRAVYKVTATAGAVYRLRFAVLAEYIDDYARDVDETINSFTTKQA